MKKLITLKLIILLSILISSNVYAESCCSEIGNFISSSGTGSYTLATTEVTTVCQQTEAMCRTSSGAPGGAALDNCTAGIAHYEAFECYENIRDAEPYNGTINSQEVREEIAEECATQAFINCSMGRSCRVRCSDD